MHGPVNVKSCTHHWLLSALKEDSYFGSRVNILFAREGDKKQELKAVTCFRLLSISPPRFWPHVLYCRINSANLSPVQDRIYFKAKKKLQLRASLKRNALVNNENHNRK
jgi:hypothetical protein